MGLWRRGYSALQEGIIYSGVEVLDSGRESYGVDNRGQWRHSGVIYQRSELHKFVKLISF